MSRQRIPWKSLYFSLMDDNNRYDCPIAPKVLSNVYRGRMDDIPNNKDVKSAERELMLQAYSVPTVVSKTTGRIRKKRADAGVKRGKRARKVKLAPPVKFPKERRRKVKLASPVSF
jgi:hypothetical protein